jgi:DNA-binding response OmpR family regulator
LLSIAVVSEETEQINRLSADIEEKGLYCSVVHERNSGRISERSPDLVLVVIDELTPDPAVRRLLHEIKQELHLPVIALLSNKALHNLDPTISIDDFVVEPWDAVEVAVRTKRILQITENGDDTELIKCGDLTIDMARCQVFVSGRPVILTFKEYQLLRFLASNRGKVFNRDTLLNKVWGYDYFGGDRTVDVHIRRLRSKLDDAPNTFIETVRNIGYRFREEP